jgi:Arc/MetJ-type ribon-helix-helix transcriptional regulator
MAKIEIEIPDDYVKFIKEWQKYRGETVSVAKYIQGSMKCLLEGDYGWMWEENRQKAKELYALMKSGEAAEV